MLNLVLSNAKPQSLIKWGQCLFHKGSYIFFIEGYQEIIMNPHEIASYSKPEKETSEMGCAATLFSDSQLWMYE